MYLNLTGHICREVELSMAVVNLGGISQFSESVRIFIEGGNLLYCKFTYKSLYQNYLFDCY